MAPCMSSILALSVSDKIEQYGAYAGFASVLGLAVLSLLYFAQAREVKRLREWAGRAPERAADVQDRAVAAAQQRVIAQPQRPAQPAAAPAQPGARPAAATPAGQAAGAAAPAPAAAAAATAAGAATATPPGAPPTPPATDQPTTVSPAANGAAAAATAGGAPTPPARPGQPLRVPGAAQPGATTARAAAQQEPEDEGRSRTAIFGAVGAIAVVLVVLAVLLTGVLGGDDEGGKQPSSTISQPGQAPADDASATKKPKKSTTAAAPKAGSYTVAVLNGTTVPGLARGVANRLTEAKHKIGNVTNASTQDRSATLVEFAPGHRAEADAVAKAIEVGSDAIQPLSAGSKAIAGEQATVVVTVGADQNTSPQSATTTG